MTAFDRDWNNPDDMLALAREALADWRKAQSKTAAERHSSRLLAFAFGRLDDLAAEGKAPTKWMQP